MAPGDQLIDVGQSYHVSVATTDQDKLLRHFNSRVKVYGPVMRSSIVIVILFRNFRLIVIIAGQEKQIKLEMAGRSSLYVAGVEIIQKVSKL